jgi:hypothetical protein
MSSTTVKSEFTEVLTGSDLLPPRPVSISSSEEFPTIITETSLLETPTTTAEQRNLVDQYDEVFPTPNLYRQFAEAKLTSWKDTLEYQYFDSLYVYHRNTSQTIKNLRRQAMELLNEADTLTRQYTPQRRNLDHFTSTLGPSPFQRRLFSPVKVYPRARPNLRERPPTVRQPMASSSTIRPLRPPYPPQVAPRSRIRCFQCDSPSHIKWYCIEYRCKSCRKIAPGHSYKDCPRHLETEPPFDDGIRGYYDVEEDDGNLGGEC